MEVKNLNKSFGSKILYKDLSFKVDEGKIFALIGPNGVGKTSLMKLILGWDKAYTGQILIPKGLSLSYSPESPEFPDFLKGSDLLDFFIGLRKAEENSKDLMDLLGLDSKSKTLIKNYSKGMKQRLGVAQALVGDPDILLLDEPTAGLDYFGQRLMTDLFKGLKNEGKTIILNSHLLLDVEEICDQGLIIMGPDLYQTFDRLDLEKKSLGQMFMDLAEEKKKRGQSYE